MSINFTRTVGSIGFSLLLAGVISLVVDAQAQQPAPPKPIDASTPGDRGGRQVSLYDQLRVGLKAKTKVDIEFLQKVVDRVEQDVLPRKMVDATFLWARNRYRTRPANHRLRPIVYFQPALTAQAKRIGVVL